MGATGGTESNGTIALTGATYTIVQNCAITPSVSSGIALYVTDHCQLLNNSIITADGSYSGQSDCIWLGGDDTPGRYTSNCTVSGNYLEQRNDNGTYHCDLIQLYATDDVTICYNYGWQNNTATGGNMNGMPMQSIYGDLAIYGNLIS